MSGPDTAQLRELQASLNASIDDYVDASAQEGGAAAGAASQRITAHASKLVSAMTNPTLANLLLGLQSSIITVVRTAVDLDLFNVVDGPTKISDIAAKTHADEVLILRLTRLLVAFDYLEEVSKGYVWATPLGRNLRAEPVAAWIKTSFDVGMTINGNIPAFLKETGYRNPDHTASVAEFALAEKFFDYLKSHPDAQASFNTAMRIQEMTARSSVPVFAFSEQAGEVTADSVSLVDVAGGHGQYLETLAKTNAGLKGRVILQDLPDVVAGVDRSKASFEVMGYDFFTPQTVVGARFYHLRRILHDWSDKESRDILLNQAKAFKRGYSKLLLNENVLPEVGCGQREALLDLNMIKLNGMERSRGQWESLLGSAGFRVVKIWAAETGTGCFIEAELRDR